MAGPNQIGRARWRTLQTPTRRRPPSGRRARPTRWARPAPAIRCPGGRPATGRGRRRRLARLSLGYMPANANCARGEGGGHGASARRARRTAGASRFCRQVGRMRRSAYETVERGRADVARVLVASPRPTRRRLKLGAPASCGAPVERRRVRGRRSAAAACATAAAGQVWRLRRAPRDPSRGRPTRRLVATAASARIAGPVRAAAGAAGRARPRAGPARISSVTGGSADAPPARDFRAPTAPPIYKEPRRDASRTGDARPKIARLNPARDAEEEGHQCAAETETLLAVGRGAAGARRLTPTAAAPIWSNTTTRPAHGA